jgi:hypothetical protein
MEDDEACKDKHEEEDAKSLERVTGGGRQAIRGSHDITTTDNDEDIDNENTQQSKSAREKGGEEDGSNNDNCYGGFAHVVLCCFVRGVGGRR